MPAMGYKEIVCGKIGKELGYADDIKMMTISAADNTGQPSDTGRTNPWRMYFQYHSRYEQRRFAEITKQYYENHGTSGMALHVDGLVSFSKQSGWNMQLIQQVPQF